MSLFNLAYLDPVLRYRISILLLLGHSTSVAFGFPHCAKNILESKSLKSDKEVFTSEEDASSFLRRRLLYNQFDFEMFVSGNLERECNEELCSYEEAREIFEDQDATMTFWKKYTSKDVTSSKALEIDVVGLLTGLISAGTLLVIIGLVVYYVYSMRCHPRRHINVSEDTCECRRISHVASGTEEEHPLQPIYLPSVELGPPPYDQAVIPLCDLPPPPYPGSEIDAKVYRKSYSIPASQEF
ncbi:transmembrane gamma-carboxyglutamic acid protein 4 [Pelobates fuscus]|uniref:transmembrane gamma-carboxyglutamic acid protein 4 n=1 Tax=Pelobates fuscus TaxID=191477 RepID=UPI002FE490A1